MAYNNLIPSSPNLLSVDQPAMQTNFAAIQTLIGINHVNFDATGQGKHTFVEFPVQSPVPTTAAGEVGLYCQTSTQTTQPELVFARQSGSTAPAAVRISEFTSAGWANPGWCVLPSGIMMKWRSGIPFGGMQNVTINLNSTSPTSPNFATVLTILITAIDTAGTYDHVTAIKSIAVPSFTVYTAGTPPGTLTFAYLAIGY